MDKLFVCAGDIESFDFATSIGIGLVNASINLTKICMEQKSKQIIFVGTAGSYGKIKIGDIITSDISANVEISYIEQKAYTPLNECIVSRETFANTLVNSSNYITANKEASKRFLSLGYGLENMEFFAIQKVASSFNIPSSGIFYVTNYCDENAHDDFLKNHHKAKEELKKYIEKKYDDT